jgi:hypothetical protein
VFSGVHQKVKRRLTGRRAPLAHGKLTWWSGVSELEKGREESVSK